MSFFPDLPIDPYRSSAVKTAIAGTRRHITNHVVIIRHCRVMIRECTHPLLYAFFLPLPLKGSTEIVDGLNICYFPTNFPLSSSIPVVTVVALCGGERIAQFAINSSLRETKMLRLTMVRSAAVPNTIDLTIYVLSRSLPRGDWRGLHGSSAMGKCMRLWGRRRTKREGEKDGRKKTREETRRKRSKMRWCMVEAIRGLNIYHETKSKTQDDRGANSYDGISEGKRGARNSCVSDEIYSYLTLRLSWRFLCGIVSHYNYICYRWHFSIIHA